MFVNNAIKFIETQNFQSHANSKIELAPAGQLTVIVGPSDSGKSAILRAMRWLLSNSPQGTDFIRAKCTFARETIHYESGHTVIRERTASKNQYKIIAPEATEPLILEGFGNNVPFEVQEITGVRRVTIGDLKLNLNVAEQLDGPFLGNSMSAGARAKVIGKLSGNEEIDFANKELGTDLYRRNQDEKRLRAEVDQLIETIATYDYLPRLKQQIEQVDLTVATIKKHQSQREKLYLIKSQLESAGNLIADCNGIINHWQFVEIVGAMATEIAEKASKAAAITRLGQQIKGIDTAIDNTKSTICRLYNVEAAELALIAAVKKDKDADSLADIRFLLVTNDNLIIECQNTVKRLHGVEQADQVIAQVDDRRRRLNQILQLSQNMDIADLSIKRVNDVLKGLTGLNVADVIQSGIRPTINRRDTLFKLKAVNVALDCSINDLKSRVIIHEQRVAELEDAYRDELVAAGVCPTCGAITNPLAKVN
jgi:exonuclease SbcC